MKTLIKPLVLILLIVTIPFICAAQYQGHRVKTITEISVIHQFDKENTLLFDTVKYHFHYDNGKLTKIDGEAKANSYMHPNNRQITFNYEKNLITSVNAGGKVDKQFEFDKNNNLIRYVADGNEYSMKYEKGNLVYLFWKDLYLNYKETFDAIKYDQKNNLNTFAGKRDFGWVGIYENEKCTGMKYVANDDTTRLLRKYRVTWNNGMITRVYHNDVMQKQILIDSIQYDNEGKIIKEEYFKLSGNGFERKKVYKIEYEAEAGNDSILYSFNNWPVNIFLKKQRTYEDLPVVRY